MFYVWADPDDTRLVLVKGIPSWMLMLVLGFLRGWRALRLLYLLPAYGSLREAGVLSTLRNLMIIWFRLFIRSMLWEISFCLVSMVEQILRSHQGWLVGDRILIMLMVAPLATLVLLVMGESCVILMANGSTDSMVTLVTPKISMLSLFTSFGAFLTTC